MDNHKERIIFVNELKKDLSSLTDRLLSSSGGVIEHPELAYIKWGSQHIELGQINACMGMLRLQVSKLNPVKFNTKKYMNYLNNFKCPYADEDLLE
jgi:hypothetical protein